MLTALDDGGSSSNNQHTNLVIASNRLPVRRVRERDQMVWKPSAGGLVSALTPVLHRLGGVWVGWGGHHNVAAPATYEGIELGSVQLTQKDVQNYYYGFSNASIWPLYHDAIRPAEFHEEWWRAYEQVNVRFAQTISARAPRGATVWVQDYHLHRVPALLRRMRPDVKIGFFLHIPFPPPELFQQLPWRDELLRGLLGADLVGFHIEPYAANFQRAAQQLGGVVARPDGLLVADGHRLVRTGAFPISIDTASIEKLACLPRMRHNAARLRGKLGGGRRVILGVDRLDYTKGIEQRLHAYLQLLNDRRVRPDQCVLVQIAVPSRQQLPDYANQRAAVERLIGEINGRHGEPGRAAVHYIYRSLPMDRLAAYYMAADVMTVTPLRDGMNLVAKEYVATRIDNDGVLVLSEFAGAAAELRDAELVNPHDSEALAQVLERSLNMAPRLASQRMRAMRRVVQSHDVHRWAASFLRALSQCTSHSAESRLTIAPSSAASTAP